MTAKSVRPSAVKKAAWTGLGWSRRRIGLAASLPAISTTLGVSPPNRASTRPDGSKARCLPAGPTTGLSRCAWPSEKSYGRNLCVGSSDQTRTVPSSLDARQRRPSFEKASARPHEAHRWAGHTGVRLRRSQRWTTAPELQLIRRSPRGSKTAFWTARGCRNSASIEPSRAERIIAAKTGSRVNTMRVPSGLQPSDVTRFFTA